MKILPVPFVSQILPGGMAHNNDCGAASALMVMRAYGIGLDLTVDRFYDQLVPYGDMALSAGTLQTALSKRGITSRWAVDAHMHDLYDTLAARAPIIALIHYAPLVETGLTEKSGFRGAHFVVVIGMDIENVCIRDPYTSREDSMTDVPLKIFERCWSECTADANPKYAGLFVNIPIQDLTLPTIPTSKYILAVNGLNVRSGPSSSYLLVRTIWKTVQPYVDILEVSGLWGRIHEGWVYMPYLKRVIS